MALFDYTARDSRGELVHGTLDAENIDAAQRLLQQKGFYPTDISEPFSRRSHAEQKKKSLPALHHKISGRELAVFTRKIAVLLQASVPIFTAIENISRAGSSRNLALILAVVKEKIKNGESFAGALASCPAVFSPVYISMVRAGEHAGTLDTVLEELAGLLEHQSDTRSNIQSALAYPLFLLLVGSVLITVLFTVMVPEISRVFLEAGRPLPLPTKVLIRVSRLATAFWWLPPMLAVVFLLVWKTGKAAVVPAVSFDRTIARMPLLGGIIIQTACARFCRVLAVLLKGGVPLLHALPMAGRAGGNKIFIEMADQAAHEIRNGLKLGQILASAPFLPEIALELITVGEQSGRLEQMLVTAASFLEQESARRLRTLVSLTEPVMICLMGLIIGFVVISLFLPLMEMNRFIG